MNTLEFEVHNQTLVRVDSADIISKNKNLYKCVFVFDEDSEWMDLNKFVLFTDGWGNSRTQHLGNNSNVLSCLVPDKMLKGSYFKISVYAGDLITTNNVSVNLIQSGYNRPKNHHHHNHHHHYVHDCQYDNEGKDIFVEIFDRLDNTIDSLVYDNHTLHLFNRDTIIESVYIPFVSEEDVNRLLGNFTDYMRLASSENDGLLSKEDKVKLDNIDEFANHTIVDSELDNSSTNPVMNSVVSESFTRLDTELDGTNSRLTDLGNRLNDLDIVLTGKEDVYDFVERLDNVIVDLINKE